MCYDQDRNLLIEGPSPLIMRTSSPILIDKIDYKHLGTTLVLGWITCCPIHATKSILCTHNSHLIRQRALVDNHQALVINAFSFLSTARTLSLWRLGGFLEAHGGSFRTVATEKFASPTTRAGFLALVVTKTG